MSDLDNRRRRHLIIGSTSALLLVVLCACVAAVVYNSSDNDVPHPPSTLHSSSKSVEMFCASTDYHKTCESSLSKVVRSENPDPKDLIHAAISVVFDEIGAAFNRTSLIRTNDTRIKGAIEDCRELFVDSKEELKSSLEVIVKRGIDHLPDRADDVRTWLSAVMSYQQTCIDGFPKGAVKTRLEDEMKKAKELTSNALAIIRKAARFLSMLNDDGLGGSRRLLAEEDQEEDVEEDVEGEDGGAIEPDDMPGWAEEGEARRVLQEGKHIKLTPNVTVAKDGSGQFQTITDALEAMPKTYKGRYVIYVKPGVYEESVIVPRTKANVTMYGDSPSNTIVTGSKNFVDGTRTFQTATFAVIGEGFIGFRMTFRNTAGAIKHQAVALRVQSDRSIFLACNIEGYQDTLYAQTHRQLYRGCLISGTVDFIFGDAAAVFQNCIIVVRRPLDNQQNIVTAQGRLDRHESTGFVIHRCRIIPDTAFTPVVGKFSSYLGRPWKEYSKIVIMESEIGVLIRPEGYMPWEGDFALKTLSYAEYNNYGPGSVVTARVKWPGVKVLTKEEAKPYTVANFIQGRDWIKKAGVPVPVRMALYDN